jgi:ABC-type uncharacterized transport system substrate-binding protein
MRVSMTRTLLAGAVALLLAVVPRAGTAHPHVFIDAGIDFLFDAEGRLSHVRIAWRYDFLSSLLLLEDLGITEGEDGSISDADKAALAQDQTQWVEGFEGDASLHHGTERMALSRPIEPQAGYDDGYVEIRFLRRLAEPIVPGPDTIARLYDPTYFVDYALAAPPGLEHAPPSCTVRVEPVEPTGPLAALQQSLFELGPDEEPDEPVGHLFADRIILTCD